MKGYSYVKRVYTDVTSTIFPVGAASVLGQVITLPECKALTEGITYRVEIKFSTSEGDVKEAFARIVATR